MTPRRIGRAENRRFNRMAYGRMRDVVHVKMRVAVMVPAMPMMLVGCSRRGDYNQGYCEKKPH